ncbi:MAG: DUF2735 domain-containing protein [Gemmatimonas sp.]
MTTSPSHGSAKIYQFPVGGRAALGGRRYGESKAAIEQKMPGAAETVCSGSWYHEEAIREANPSWEQ